MFNLNTFKSALSALVCFSYIHLTLYIYVYIYSYFKIVTAERDRQGKQEREGDELQQVTDQIQT